MNLLALDTSTEWLSIAVQRRGVAPPWHLEAAGGAQSSARLIDDIQQLMAQAGLRFDQLDAIVFGAGPGAFTGLRTACAVTQGLAFGAHLTVLPFDTLLSVAEMARAQLADAGPLSVTALLDARMDEMYVARYLFDQGRWLRTEEPQLIKPEALYCPPGDILAGNVFTPYGARLPGAAQRVDVRPNACAMLRLAPAALAAGGGVSAAQALPIYIRDKVAQTTQERQAQRAGAGT